MQLRAPPSSKHLLTIYLICCVHGVVLASGGYSRGELYQTTNDLLKPKRGLIILPHPSPQNIMIKRIDETLNLTCLIEPDMENCNRSLPVDQNNEQYKLSWYLGPLVPQNSKQRVSFNEERNALTVIVSNLKESDSGDYVCEARSLADTNFDLALSKSVKIIVKPKKNSCGDPFFSCSTGECISKRFVCDGKSDCKEGSDETPTVCGTSFPCEGKLKCEDGRCISRHWCCERWIDPNCTIRVSPSCCKQLPPLQFSLDVSQYPSQSQQFSDMGFLQTTIYTVIGCAMAFMFIITIMVIAICRVHLKRTTLPRYPHHMNQASQRQDSWGNIFLHSNGGNLPYTSAASGLLVTYNINNGVQFVGRPVNPPPYSEIVRAPPREGPPPPYASEENIASTSAMSSSASPSENVRRVSEDAAQSGHSAQPPLHLRRNVFILEGDPEALATLEPLLSENNNGDINGNSTSEVQVEPNSNITTAYDYTSRDSNLLSVADCQI